MIVLEPSDGQPGKGSVVIDAFGVLWQHRVLAGEEGWFEAGFERPVPWASLWALGPLCVLSINLSGSVLEHWPPAADTFLPPGVETIGDNPWGLS